MKKEMKFVNQLAKNSMRVMKTECAIEKATGIGKITFPMKRKVATCQ